MNSSECFSFSLPSAPGSSTSDGIKLQLHSPVHARSVVDVFFLAHARLALLALPSLFLNLLSMTLLESKKMSLAIDCDW